MKYLRPLLAAAALSLLGHAAAAQVESKPEQGYTRFDKHTVYYSVFNSTMVTPEVAQLHQLTRDEDLLLVNVALVANEGTDGGQAAEVSGNVRNLMQQRRDLNFKAIVEDKVIYYLAPLPVTDGEVLHFSLEVDPRGNAGPYTVKFSRMLYGDN